MTQVRSRPPRLQGVLEFVTRMSAMIGLVVLLQYGVWGIFPELIGPPPFWVNVLNHGTSGTVLYFGDSTTFTYSPDEVKTQDMAEIIEKHHPNIDIDSFFLPATSVRLFAEVLDKRLRKGRIPSCVIMDVNPDVFSDFWFRRPVYKEAWRVWALRFASPIYRAWFRPAEVFGVTAPMSIAEYNQIPIYWEGRCLGTYGDTFDDKVAQRRREQLWLYASLLSPYEDSRLLQHWRRLLRLCEERDIPLLLYMTPVNYEAVSSLYGKDYRGILEAKRDFLLKTLRGRNVTLLDLTFDLPASYFQSSALNHHLRYEGREYVALRVGQGLQKILSKNARTTNGGSKLGRSSNPAGLSVRFQDVARTIPANAQLSARYFAPKSSDFTKRPIDNKDDARAV